MNCKNRCDYNEDSEICYHCLLSYKNEFSFVDFFKMSNLKKTLDDKIEELNENSKPREELEDLRLELKIIINFISDSVKRLNYISKKVDFSSK